MTAQRGCLSGNWLDYEKILWMICDRDGKLGRKAFELLCELFEIFLDLNASDIVLIVSKATLTS